MLPDLEDHSDNVSDNIDKQLSSAILAIN